MAEFDIRSSDIKTMYTFLHSSYPAFLAGTSSLKAKINGLINLPESDFSGGQRRV